MKLFLFLISCTLIYTVTALDETNGACAELGEGFHLKPNTGCKTYYSCVAGGTGMEYDCPDGYLFNDEEKVCAREGTFECDSGPLPVCPAEGVEQIPIPGTGCQKFFLCIDGTPIERECAEGLLFDEDIGKCDLEEKVECFDCPERDDPFNLVYFPDKKNCAGYYICLKGEPQPFTCADGLHYQESIKKCNEPETAACRFIDYTTESPGTTAIFDDE